ncbi:hypothetical protein KFL_003040100 [Klebsormidium nitens]|uniref:Senescence domain-containing protein n=1 Tax=Klebsormidium nitens TaxID=105231 RepID=A0A1Y1I826_KLENI|nr:hypothetical protein KFL_003040100 [Klebsormidium nitens]|eukprot:GAQ86683.1 hypothetical protein KFL_003040100 [Klebsormidium nitens]
MTEDWYRTQDSVQQALTGLQSFINQGRQEVSKSLKSQEDIAVTERLASAITVGSIFLADQIEAGGHVLTQNISKKGAVWRERSRLKKEVRIAPALLGGVTTAANWSGKIEDVAEGFKGHVQGVKKAVAANIGRVAQETGHTERLPREIVGLGSMTVASFDAFARVRDAAEDAAREVLTEGSTVASDVVALRYGQQAGALAKECFEGVGNIVDAAIAVDNVIWKLQPEVFAISFTKKTMRHVVGSHLARICAEEYDCFAIGST